MSSYLILVMANSLKLMWDGRETATTGKADVLRPTAA
jgi:hypothetical protein